MSPTQDPNPGGRTAHRAAEIMSSLGLDGFDVFLIQGEGRSISARDGELETVTSSRESGLALRAMIGRRIGLAFTFDLSEEALKETAAKAEELAGLSEPDPELDLEKLLAGPPRELPQVLTVDPDRDGIGPEAKEEAALRMERIAREFDPRVVKVREAAFEEALSRVWLVNSRGADLYREKTLYEVGLSLMAKEGGESQMGHDFSFSPLFSELEVEECARRAAEQAVSRLGARKAGSGSFPVVVDNTTMAMILSVLAPAFLAENVRKGKSLLAGKQGRKIFADPVTVIDDGLYPLGAGIRPFDDEGTPHQTTPLVESGTLTGLLYDRTEALKAGRSSTGNGKRGGIKTPPGGAVNNLYLQPGRGTLADLVAGVEEGFLITELMGLHTADPVSGDFSLGAAGTWIKNGKKAYPVQGAAISGNLMDFFSRISAVGGDLRFLGTVGSPSLALESLDVAG